MRIWQCQSLRMPSIIHMPLYFTELYTDPFDLESVFFFALIRFCVAPQHIQCGDRFSDHTPKYQSKHAKRIFFSVPVLNCIYTFS